MTTIKSWSCLRILDFESCKLKAKLKLIDKIPEPERPLPPGKTEHYNDRGTRLHTSAELFVQGKEELIPELEKFRDEFEVLRTQFKAGKATLEGEWAFDRDWNPVEWKSSDAWVRLKCDAVIWKTPTHAVIVDYKSGKRFGNELKHGEQVQFYALAVFLRYPEIEEVTVELWYLDVDELVPGHFTRTQGLRHLAPWTKRGARMTEATTFPPNPNIFSCRYCPYGPEGTGHCTVGVPQNGRATQKLFARKNR